MGVEFHITRAQFWAENEDAEIAASEWLAYIAGDPELQLQPQNGAYFVRWLGPSKYPAPWLNWFEGNISTKWPDTALYLKMLKIATALSAKVQDDNGTVYPGDAEWEFDPSERIDA